MGATPLPPGPSSFRDHTLTSLWRIIDDTTEGMRRAEVDGDSAAYQRHEARWNAAWDEVERRERQQEERRERATQRKARRTEAAA